MTREVLGKAGEAFAVDFLKKQGYAILGTNVRSIFGELDIVAQDGPVICFVEVKTRTSPEYGGPWAAISRAKKRKLTKLARHFIASRHLEDCPARFDVVAILKRPQGDFHVDLFQDAFEAVE